MIANSPELAVPGMADLRALALQVAATGLAACDVTKATADVVTLTDRGITIDGREYSLQPHSRVVVVGSGKATLAIASALEDVLGDRLEGGAVAVRDGAATISLSRIELHLADHPLPSERSQAAARRIMEIAGSLGPDDLVFAVFTGGSSALTSLPPAGVTQAEKRRLHELLLGSGAPIADVNTVRKHVSAFKGGRVAAAVSPARLVNLAVSDVPGDVLETLTDPSVQDTSTVDDAVEVLRERRLWDALPESIRSHLGSEAAVSPTLAVEPQTAMLANGASVCKAMAAEAQAAGLAAHVVSTDLEGEAKDVGRQLAEVAVGCARSSGPIAPPCVLIGCGGEATVTLGGTGSAFGSGGPNQEAAIAASLYLDPETPVAGCFLDTDGSDGGTDAAGAIVDGLTTGRARAAGVDLEAALTAHRSGDALAAIGDQIFTGPTQTNVNDLFVLAVGAGPA